MQQFIEATKTASFAEGVKSSEDHWTSEQRSDNEKRKQEKER
jgi:hypothetical protein